jgi:hypothetical protein
MVHYKKIDNTMSENHHSQDDHIYTKEIIEFTTVANEFCKLLENLQSQSRKEFIHNTYKILTLLQSKVILLADFKKESEFESESFVNEADWHFIDTAISEKLGSFEIFSELREPADPEVFGEVTISECLADTYQDLKDFTQIFQLGNPEAVAQAIFECKNSYEQYWGPRIMIVIRELHLLIYGERDLDEEESQKQLSEFSSKK